MPWNMPVLRLLWPITVAAGLLEEIQLRPFTHAEHTKALEEVGKDEDDQFIALAKLATGLTDEELDQLKRPDYVSLSEIIADYVMNKSEHFLGVPENADCVPLLVPIKVMGRDCKELHLEVPALSATKAMKKLRTPLERSRFITAHCTGLMAPDVGLLSVPDWNQLQERINDFLNKPAAFFQTGTST